MYLQQIFLIFFLNYFCFRFFFSEFFRFFFIWNIKLDESLILSWLQFKCQTMIVNYFLILDYKLVSSLTCNELKWKYNIFEIFLTLTKSHANIENRYLGFYPQQKLYVRSIRLIFIKSLSLLATNFLTEIRLHLTKCLK